tara:strand:- start:24 stop:425 length:402 start_codon:yes stop_codon:yes gene_type:complete
MNSKLTICILSLLILFNFSSCSKVEGEGGAATIKGKITVHDYNNAGTILQDTYPGADKDVYIVYGNENTFYDNDIKTSYDGSFEFRYLQKGNYQIFVYEEVQGAVHDTVIIYPVSISERKQVFDLGEIIIRRY